MKYAILKNPAHTKVSFKDTDDLAVSELTVIAPQIGAKDIALECIGGVQYIVFNGPKSLSNADVTTLSRLSFAYAIFAVQDNGLFSPIQFDANCFINQELSTILKYVGKTNELFTRFMLNLAQNSIAGPVASSYNILDPVAGKGTTLYEALIQGHNAYGMEIDAKLVGETVVYMKKYLETARYKHENHAEKTSGQTPSGKFTAVRNQIKITRTKGEEPRHFEIVAGDTRHISSCFKKNHFHAIIADLPYGVQHSSKKPGTAGFTRNATGLLAEALPGWAKVLKPGGVIVLAWNLFLIPRATMEELLTSHGFAVKDKGVNFAHWVDNAINRDIIVATLQN